MRTPRWAPRSTDRLVGSPVRIEQGRRASASATTSASTVEFDRDSPRSRPARRAVASSRRLTPSVELMTRLTGASRGPEPRTVSATTAAGTNISTPRTRAFSSRRLTARSPRAILITAPASSTGQRSVDIGGSVVMDLTFHRIELCNEIVRPLLGFGRRLPNHVPGHRSRRADATYASLDLLAVCREWRQERTPRPRPSERLT